MAITALIIMDGFGINPVCEGNAICKAGTPNVDKLIEKYSMTQIGASGLSVGLPEGQMGNSEVGHLNIGAGRVVYQELTRITKSIEDGDFFENKAFLGAIESAKKSGGKVHFIGLCSDGGVHSHLDHLYALLTLMKRHGMADKAFVHCLMDGRDVPPSSGKDYILTLEDKMAEIGCAAQLRMQVAVAALGGADRPGAAGIVGAGGQGVVGALAEAGADGMDGRQVKHVEPHRRHVRQARFHVLKCAVPARLVCARARKQLIPRAKARSLAVNHDLQFFGIGGGIIARAMDAHQPRQFG